jgi:hypothetical protein
MPLGTSRTEQGSGADALQLTLRFSFRARLTASVRHQVSAEWKGGMSVPVVNGSTRMIPTESTCRRRVYG